MPSSMLTSKGQITLSKAVRETLQIAPGDRVAFRIQEDGTVLVEAETADLLALQVHCSRRCVVFRSTI